MYEAMEASQTVHVKQGVGRSGRLFIFLRTSDRPRNEKPYVALRTQEGEPIAKVGDQGVCNLSEGFCALSLELSPGTYILVHEASGLGMRGQAVLVEEGWQTQLFIPWDKDSAGVERALVAMVPERQGFDPHREWEYYRVEAALAGLARGRIILTRTDERELLKGKSADPMLSLIGAYGLVCGYKNYYRCELDKQDVKDWPSAINRQLLLMLPHSPDAHLLHPLLQRLAPEVSTPPVRPLNPFDAPPMFSIGAELLLGRSAEDRPAKSWTTLHASNGAGGSVFTRWNLDELVLDSRLHRPASAVRSMRAGLHARHPAFRGNRHLVFLNGGHHDRDPDTLRSVFAAGLNQGLKRAGLPPVDPVDIWYPYYGDVLAPVHTSHEVPSERAAPSDPSIHRVYEQIIGEAASIAGLPQEGQMAAKHPGLGAARALAHQLGWLAATSDLDEWAIAKIFRDVAVYLDDRHVREAVLGRVLETVPDTGDLVLISHGFGTVVSMDLITQLSSEVHVVHLTTTGSPLGLNNVYSRLLAKGPKRPEKVTDWLNVWCPTDAIAIGCPLQGAWGSGLTEIAVANTPDRAHSVVEYLSHAEVAGTIGNRFAG
ncbi:hypothetical protein [Streptomyces yangpuensis]|uniref:hypothetical protein n=1 Tax=Streptomyces yangpuensis TaxID=1648182 RepID=UPI0036761D76